MRIVVQRVKRVKVIFENQNIAEIEKGILIYIGIIRNEPQSSLDWLLNNIKDMRNNDDDILCLSQFTLFGEFKGSKPSFHHAENTEIAEKYFYMAVDKIKNNFECKVKNGLFGKDLQIEIEGDPISTIYRTNE